MIEYMVVVGVLSGIGMRARQRGLNRTLMVVVAALGWLTVLILSAMLQLEPLGLIARSVWLGLIWLFIEMWHFGARVPEYRWQCPDCRLFNDSSNLFCLCGYRYPR